MLPTKKNKKKQTTDDIIIGISSCLLGKKVRFDAGHKHDRYITDLLGQFVEFMPVCPEVEIGMGVPREAVRLVDSIESPRMVGNKTGTDWTDRMNMYSIQKVKEKSFEHLSGFILKNRSPSCGMERVKVYLSPEHVDAKGTGLFAKVLLKQYPHIPVEEEGRLNDHQIRENYIERVFAYHRIKKLFNGKLSRKAVIDFHANHKFQLLSHNTELYRELGRLVGDVKNIKPAKFREKYVKTFMACLKYKSTPNKNRNVLEHIAGHFKKDLDEPEKQNLHQTISDYHRGFIPLIVPITLLKLFTVKYEKEYIQNQSYLNPHPKELMLRNHV